ncbi:MAG: hypothetical protein K2X77_23660 [Candidatus Obscuribacterales bacterium]|jgi:hypothetical protein|nr:hypothetical protein [Candidatus Obscuribacterales bacterium]
MLDSCLSYGQSIFYYLFIKHEGKAMKLAHFAAAISIAAFVVAPSALAQSFNDVGEVQSTFAADTASDWWSGSAPQAQAQAARASRPTSSYGYAPRYNSLPVASSMQMADLAGSADRAFQTAGRLNNAVNAVSTAISNDDSSHVMDAAEMAISFAKAAALTRLKPTYAFSMKVPPAHRGW